MNAKKSYITFNELHQEFENSLNSKINQDFEKSLDITHDQNSEITLDTMKSVRFKEKHSQWYLTKTSTFLNEILPSRKYYMFNASDICVSTYTNVSAEQSKALHIFKLHIDNSKVNQSNLTYDKLEAITEYSRSTIAACHKCLYAYKLLYYNKEERIYYINPDYFWNCDPDNIFTFSEDVLAYFGINGINNFKRKFNHYIQMDAHKATNDFLNNIAKEKSQAFNMFFILSLKMTEWGSINMSQKELAKIFDCSVSKIKYILKFLKEKELIRITRNDKHAFSLLKKGIINNVTYHNKYEINSAIIWKRNNIISFMYFSDVAGVHKARKESSDMYHKRKEKLATLMAA